MMAFSLIQAGSAALQREWKHRSEIYGRYYKLIAPVVTNRSAQAWSTFHAP